MTMPRQPASQPLPGEPGWDDARLAAAFAARSARVVVPVDLAAVTVERLRPTARRSPWARLLPAGAALVLVLAVVGGGIAVLGGPAGLLGSGAVTFRDGPTPDLRTLDGAEYALDFPASWLAYTATSAGASGGSIDAVLTTQPIEERCNGLMGVDIDCVYEQRLEPGQLRIFVGTGSYRAQTVLDRADIENGSTTRLAVGGMPAVLDEFDDAPDDYYLADQSATWAVATPTSLDRVIRIEFMAREPAVDAARAAVEALVASFRFTPPPAPLPDDPEAAAAAARAALDAEATSFRQGFVPAADTDGQTYLDCLPDAPGEDRVVGIDYGPGGDLGWTVLTRCRWTVVADEHGPFWRIGTVYEWSVGEDFGRYRETYWINAAGAVVARTNSGDVPPAGDPSATPGQDVPAEVFGLEVIDVEAALEIQARPDDSREIAVRGWLLVSTRRGCGIMAATSAIEPRCPGAWLGANKGAEGPFVVATQLPLVDMLRDAGSGGSLSSDLVAIGHFEDRRSSDCETEMEAACRDVFWVDTVWVAGEPIARDWVLPPPDDATPALPLGTADDAAAVAMSFLDDDPTRTMPHVGEVLSVGLLPGDQLATLEPTMRPSCGPDCDALFQAPAWVWHVTMLDRTLAEVRTFVIDDDEFDGSRSIIVREPTVGGVVERETMVTSADGPGIILGLNAVGLPVPIEEVDLPLQTP